MSQAYWLTLPVCLTPSDSDSHSDSTEPLNIPFDLYESNFMPNFYSLLRSGTQVMIDVFFTRANLVRVCNYMVPSDQFVDATSSQNSYLCFLDTPIDKSTTVHSYISHAYHEGGKNTLTVGTVNSSDEGQSVVLTNTGLIFAHKFKNKFKSSNPQDDS